ncbi:hydrogenase small subunit [Methanolobus sp. WCC4]|uniref:hydrogenase small subunit n=1 Tax=Methanolobus sp. WCC4 TaxID=3125784 RepID=UPI0030F5F1B9
MGELENTDFLSMDRRTFLKVVGAMGASTFLGLHRSEIVKALELSNTRVIWIHGAECTGCSESVLNGRDPDIFQAIQKLSVDVAYHEMLIQQQGIFVDGELASTSELNSEIMLEEAIEEGGYILVVEGAIANGPDGSGKYCMYGDHTFKELFSKAASNATFILAIGMCATYGGINSANSNIVDLTDFRGVAFLRRDPSKGMLTELGIDRPVINIAGCPANPDWVLLTLAAVILGKIDINDPDPILDEFKRPLVFFPEDVTLHWNCPRRGYYDIGQFDTEFSGDACLWKLGCKGPYTHSDCALRKWNGSVNMCTQAGSPCISCCEPGFFDNSTPFYKNAQSVAPSGGETDRSVTSNENNGAATTGSAIGLGATAGATIIGSAAYAARKIAKNNDDEKEMDQ